MTRVLIVEDNVLNRDMLSRRLARRGFEVTSAEDAAQGLALARSERPDVILMDLSLPGMDGWEATRSLRADPATAIVPIIALTAHAMDADRRRALEAGCDDYATKPVEFEALLASIAACLERRRREAEPEAGDAADGDGGGDGAGD